MRSSTEVLDSNKIKLSVEVDEDELKEAVDETVKRLQREVRVPGFRPGKVPRRLLEQRLGPKAIREEVIRHSLPEYYAQAVEDEALDTIAAPDIDIRTGEEEGPLAFDAVVQVRPKVSIAGYEGLQVTVPAPDASDEDVDAQIDRLREQFAQLSEVERPVRAGDVVTIDVTGTRDGEPVDDLSTTDFVYEVGTGMVAPGVDEALSGVKAGDIVEVDADEAPGGPAKLKVLVKLVREKLLPDADDDWASEASEFDTIDELRDDYRRRISSMKRVEARRAFRDGAIEALANLVDVEIPESLVDHDLEHIQNQFLTRLGESKISLEQYLAMTGQDVDTLVAELRTQAAGQSRADLALRALAEAEDLSVTDEELASEIAGYAASIGQPVAAVAKQFAEGAGLERLRSEIRNSKAVTWLVEHVEPVDDQGNEMDRAVLLEQDTSPDDSAPIDGGAVGDNTATVDPSELSAGGTESQGVAASTATDDRDEVEEDQA